MSDKSLHHVRPLWLDWEDNNYNTILLDIEDHISLHRASDLFSKLDYLLIPYHKELHSSLITTSFSWSLSTDLMQQFCRNFNWYDHKMQQLIYHSLLSSLSYHYSRYQSYLRTADDFFIKTIVSLLDNKQPIYDYDSVMRIITIDKRLHMRVARNLHQYADNLHLTIKQDISSTNDNDRVCLIPLSLRGKYHESNFVDSHCYSELTNHTIRDIYQNISSRPIDCSVNYMLNEILYHYFSHDTNMGRARRAARKVSNGFFIMWDTQWDPWKRAQLNYFTDAEKKLYELGLVEVWNQCEKQMREQARKDWKRYSIMTNQKEQFNSTHRSFDQYHHKLIEYNARMWEFLRKELQFDIAMISCKQTKKK